MLVQDHTVILMQLRNQNLHWHILHVNPSPLAIWENVLLHLSFKINAMDKVEVGHSLWQPVGLVMQLLVPILQVAFLLLDLMQWLHWDVYQSHFAHQQVQETHFVMLVDLLIAVPAFVVCLAFVALVVDLGLPWWHQLCSRYQSLHFLCQVQLCPQTLLILWQIILVELTWCFQLGLIWNHCHEVSPEILILAIVFVPDGYVLLAPP